MVVLGGMGNIYGVILGAIVLQGTNFTCCPQIKTWVNSIGQAVGNQALPPWTSEVQFLYLRHYARPDDALQAGGHHPKRQRAEELHDENPAVGRMGGRFVPRKVILTGARRMGVIGGCPEQGTRHNEGLGGLFGGERPWTSTSRAGHRQPDRPNGAGKTTFFNMVSGLTSRPPAVRVRGQDNEFTGRTSGPDGDRAYGFRTSSSLGTMSARDNVLSGMHTRLKSGTLVPSSGRRGRGAR
jgi:branched-chain amino acid transport system permease protein